MATPNQQESSRATLIVDHSVGRLSISLSQMMLIILPIVQVPTTKGTLRLKLDSSGTTRALKFLPSMVSSTSVSGPIQCKMGSPASNCGFWICPTMQTFTSGQELTDPRAGGLLSPPLWNLLGLDAIA